MRANDTVWVVLGDEARACPRDAMANFSAVNELP